MKADMRWPLWLVISLLMLCACNRGDHENDDDIITIESVAINGLPVANNQSIGGIDYNHIEVTVSFSRSIDTTAFNRERILFSQPVGDSYIVRFDRNARGLTLIADGKAVPLKRYWMMIDAGRNLGGMIHETYTVNFSTRLDTLPKFPEISDDSLLTLVQRHTFRYFWDYAHPVSGLTRERNGSGDLVTSGGSGFGLMAVIVAIERGFITRQEGFERLSRIVSFLNAPGTDRFHGAYPHWLNGSSGKAIPFSQRDNGGDLVETAFLVQGLLTVREYFGSGTPQERAMCDTITKIWEEVEWEWYRRDGQQRLYWHWSPDHLWEMNMSITGWNEALIVYVLAAASPTYPIPAEVYDKGWARDGAYPMINGKTYYGIELPLGPEYGGPLFFAHYSFLGLDPRNLADRYAGYMTQNVAHARINHQYCKTNPKNYMGYSGRCWGLSASDIPGGYNAGSPTDDRGVIVPTAAISSIPYTPEESMEALRYFYYILGDKIWGNYGFKDAFSLSSIWFADSYLAIDQGPIICMIENYRTGVLWDLFMAIDEVRDGLTRLGFTY